MAQGGLFLGCSPPVIRAVSCSRPEPLPYSWGNRSLKRWQAASDQGGRIGTQSGVTRGPEPMPHADGTLGSQAPGSVLRDPAAGCHVSGLRVCAHLWKATSRPLQPQALRVPGNRAGAGEL